MQLYGMNLHVRERDGVVIVSTTLTRHVKVNLAFHPSVVGELSTSLPGWG